MNSHEVFQSLRLIPGHGSQVFLLLVSGDWMWFILHMAVRTRLASSFLFWLLDGVDIRHLQARPRRRSLPLPSWHREAQLDSLDFTAKGCWSFCVLWGNLGWCVQPWEIKTLVSWSWSLRCVGNCWCLPWKSQFLCMQGSFLQDLELENWAKALTGQVHL